MQLFSKIWKTGIATEVLETVDPVAVEIGRALDTVIKRSAEYNEHRRKETGAKAAIVAAAKQIAPVARVTPAGN